MNEIISIGILFALAVIAGALLSIADKLRKTREGKKK